MNPGKSNSRDLSDRLQFARKIWRWMLTQTIYRIIFGAVGTRSIIYPPVMLGGASGIKLGSRVFIRDGARLECVSVGGSPATIIIDDGVSIEQNFHLVSCGTVHIGKYVTIAPNVSVVGSSHAFEEPPSDIAYVMKFGKAEQFVDIGEYCFIGIGATILSGCRIGKHSIIGAHALVTVDVPDYALAVGSPARVVKIFDHERNCWTKPTSAA